VRFERDERERPALAARPYPQIAFASPVVPIRARERIEVQRRPLSVYAEAVR
jgi:hypothetical protein